MDANFIKEEIIKLLSSLTDEDREVLRDIHEADEEAYINSLNKKK